MRQKAAVLRTAPQERLLEACVRGDDTAWKEFLELYGDLIYSSALKDVKAPFAVWESAVDLSAPGMGIVSSYRGGYGSGAGTSFAAPFVTGAYALLRARYPTLPAESLESFLSDGSVPIDNLPGNSPYRGGLGDGRVDCYTALLEGPAVTGVAPNMPWSDVRPSALVTSGASPNPARLACSVRFVLARAGIVSLRIFAPDGRLLRAENLGAFAPGSHAVPIRLADAGGRKLSPGQYYYTLATDGTTATGRLTVRP
jgi:hypothetical protein